MVLKRENIQIINKDESKHMQAGYRLVKSSHLKKGVFILINHISIFMPKIPIWIYGQFILRLLRYIRYQLVL